MDRRRFLLTSLAGVFAVPLAGEAQQAGKVYRIGCLTRGGREAAAPYNRALEEGLRALGWMDGHNVVFEHRYADLNPKRYPDLAAELVRLGVDVVVAPSTEAAVAVRRATATIPIVTTVARDPVGAALIAGLARPGGNVTGVSADAGPEIGAKILQLLKEVAPRSTRVAVLREHPAQPALTSFLAAMETASDALGVTLHVVEVQGPGDLQRAFATTLQDRPHGLVVALGAMSLTHATAIASFATRNRLTTIASNREFAEAGGLMAYSPDLIDLYRRAATYIDKILKGAKPSDLPVEQPTKFDLVINLKTAKALGLTIPPSVLARADQVIE
jgi:putative ABC transport system substrate-binding protein